MHLIATWWDKLKIFSMDDIHFIFNLILFHGFLSLFLDKVNFLPIVLRPREYFYGDGKTMESGKDT